MHIAAASPSGSATIAPLGATSARAACASTSCSTTDAGWRSPASQSAMSAAISSRVASRSAPVGPPARRSSAMRRWRSVLQPSSPARPPERRAVGSSSTSTGGTPCPGARRRATRRRRGRGRRAALDAQRVQRPGVLERRRAQDGPTPATRRPVGARRREGPAEAQGPRERVHSSTRRRRCPRGGSRSCPLRS